jgi:hypothetical protein
MGQKTSTMHKYLSASVLVIAGVGAAGRATAQSAILDLPRVSQHARVMQRIGITEITIDYHRPLVAGRKIFGGVEAYGKVWRAGANENVTIDFSDPVTIEGSPLPKGVYGLHMIPGETAWVLIFSRASTAWGSFTYDQSEDALRVTVTPRRIDNAEVLTYAFEQPAMDSTVVTMRWANVSVAFTVHVETPALVARSLREQLRGRAQFEWQPWTEAANYLLAQKVSPEEAAQYADRSIAIEDRFENEMTKSVALKALGRHDAAANARQQAIGMGTQAQIHDFARRLQAQGRHEEALALFRANITKDPRSWVAHNEAARIAVAKGDFAAAIGEMKLAVQAAPAELKAQHLNLLRRLQANDDINR